MKRKTKNGIEIKPYNRNNKKLKKFLDQTLLVRHCSFEEGFDRMMSASLEYERLKRNHKRIPKHLEDELKMVAKWRDNLPTEDWYRLIG